MFPTRARKTELVDSRLMECRVVVLAVLTTLASVLIAWLSASGPSIGLIAVSWIAAQAFLLTLPGFVRRSVDAQMQTADGIATRDHC